MDWVQIITTIIVSVVVSLGMNYLNKGSSKEVKKNVNGETELKMHRFYQIFGYIGICIALVFVVAAFYYQETLMYVIGFVMLLLFGLLGVHCLMYYRNHVLKFNDKRIIVQDWRKRTEEIHWEEINEIKFNPFSGYLKINYSLNKKLKLHQHLVGLQTFAQKLEEKTNWKASELKIPFIQKKTVR